MTVKFENIDHEVLRLAALGHEPSFRGLYDHFSVGIYRTAFRYLQSVELAEDVVQDVFLTIWANREKLTTIEVIENYLFIVTRNLCLKMLKDKAITVQLQQELAEGLSYEPLESEEEQYALITKAISLLPAQQKKIFEMAKIQGLSHERISKELNLSTSTVNNHITAAFKTVRNYLRHRILEALILFLLCFC